MEFYTTNPATPSSSCVMCGCPRDAHDTDGACPTSSYDQD